MEIQIERAAHQDNNMLNVNITDSAQEYLAGLLDKQNCEGIGIRMFVSDPGTPKAETCIAYSRPGEHNEEDLVIEYEKFNGYYEQRSIPFLDDAKAVSYTHLTLPTTPYV